MSNYRLIKLKRFVSSFTVKLCNELFFSTVFNGLYICRKIRCDRFGILNFTTKQRLDLVQADKRVATLQLQSPVSD